MPFVFCEHYLSSCFVCHLCVFRTLDTGFRFDFSRPKKKKRKEKYKPLVDIRDQYNRTDQIKEARKRGNYKAQKKTYVTFLRQRRFTQELSLTIRCLLSTQAGKEDKLEANTSRKSGEVDFSIWNCCLPNITLWLLFVRDRPWALVLCRSSFCQSARRPNITLILCFLQEAVGDESRFWVSKGCWVTIPIQHHQYITLLLTTCLYAADDNSWHYEDVETRGNYSPRLQTACWQCLTCVWTILDQTSDLCPPNSSVGWIIVRTTHLSASAALLAATFSRNQPFDNKLQPTSLRQWKAFASRCLFYH